MLVSRSRRAHRPFPNRKFKPTDPTGERGGRLEGRAMAAPAFWMQPPSIALIPNQATATTTGWVIFGGPFESFLDLSQSLSTGRPMERS